MTRRWVDGPIAAFDVETTGTSPADDRIVTAAVILIGPNRAPGEQRDVRTLDWVIHPGIPIPAEATAIHGIHDQDVADGKPARTAVLEIAKVLEVARVQGAPIVAYNASFDLTMLDHELARYGHPPLQLGPVVDPLILDRRADKYRKGSRKLIDTCRHYGVDLGAAAHGAAADAHATARLAWKICTQHKAMSDMSLDALHTSQAAWHTEWAEEFESYLHRKGQPDAVIERDWPIRRAARDDHAAVA